MLVTTQVAQYRDHMDGWDGWMWLWGTLMTLVFVAAIAGAIWAVIHATQSRPPGRDRPQDILAERYARGELTTEEYHERLEALRGSERR